MQFDQLRIGREQHAFICGATGTGKSKLAEYLVNDPCKERSIVYDPKHSRTIGEWQGQTFIYGWQELMKADREDVRRIVYRPSREPYEKNGRVVDESEDADAQLEFFRFVFNGGHRRVVIDESSSLLGEARPNYFLRKCVTQGRELGISVVALTQRPVSIPIVTMSEASRIYVFRLGWAEDRERIEKITQGKISAEEQAELPDHKFLFYDVSARWRSPRKVKLDLRGINYAAA
jgi:hypothetical protein